MMIERWWNFRRHEAGNVAIPFAISLILLLGLAAVVIDLGHAYVVKRERLR
jgi:Flp pilus assembly protein TadG